MAEQRQHISTLAPAESPRLALYNTPSSEAEELYHRVK